MSDSSLQSLLRDTSRSFYLTLRILPRAVRPQIGLAYLLARTTDTIADTELVPLEARLRALADLRDRIMGAPSPALNLAQLSPSQTSEPERLLLDRVEETLRIFNGLAEEDKRLIREVLNTIISGQELDLKRFGPPHPPNPRALETEAELDDYTYRVAGCVGEFWTRLCRAHLFPGARVDDAMLLRDGIRFGKGLQLVNILRDLPADLRKGRCYIPRQSLAAAGLAPEDLRSAANEPRFRALYQACLDRAGDHLLAGWNYTNALPRRPMAPAPGLRLAGLDWARGPCANCASKIYLTQPGASKSPAPKSAPLSRAPSCCPPGPPPGRPSSAGK